MKLSRKLTFDIVAGLLLSSIFCTLLVQQIMAGGVGSKISFTEFLSAPENIIFSLLMSSFVFASWLMRGPNNRVVLFCWALLFLVYYSIFWWIYDYFQYRFLNIYMVYFAGVIASLPVLLILRFRITYTSLLFEHVVKSGVFKPEIDNYLSHAKTTDFEFKMKWTLYLAFGVEFLYALYLSLYGLANRIPYNGSVYEHISNNNHWDPFDIYMLLMNLLSFCYVLIINYYLFKDNVIKDGLLTNNSVKEKRDIALQMLEDRRRKSLSSKHKNNNKK